LGGVLLLSSLTVPPGNPDNRSASAAGPRPTVALARLPDRFPALGPPPIPGMGLPATSPLDNWSSATIWPHPSNRDQTQIAFDPSYPTPVGPAVVMVEGKDATGILSDVWEFTVGGGWALSTATGPSPARYDAQMIYNGSDNALVLVGGVTAGSTPSADVWWGVGSSWTKVSSFTGGARWGFGLVYDPSAGPNGFTILFGGATGSADSGAAVVGGGPGQGDTWEYLNTPTWTEVSLYG
jgi:hypothetical protein